ncbi:LOW QUALITY PROTEIN: hydrolase, alpha/beta fold family [Brevundimonas abyssalis TAR-001]|uniref:Hydrolase, alpha/beta fold family n=1 Tax=Brevundimonas abyssalis TAR-001 TaxID=1391729 RepID=A0A8E0NDW1_9CAUL|nr:LOW QUALITY PROTEIN: hydrolase, alpha/beta fold family [Brevundimonas abyssalis TAR-001]
MLSAIALAALIQSAPASEDIVIPSEPAPLHGTLLTPVDARAAAVLIPGSGPTDRDGNQMPAIQAATLRLMAEALADDGIATVRIDKRGVGASAMAALSEDALRFDHMAEDARAWAAELAQRTGRDCVWLMGHSEGGLVAQVAAADNPQVCGVVLLASAGRPAADILREQLAALPQPLNDQAMDGLSEMEAGRTVETIPGLEALFRPSVQPYLISWFRHDPRALAAAWDRPMLIVHATRDIQVNAADADAWATAQPNAARLDLEGVNHVLKAAPEDRAGNIAVYADPDAPLAEGLADAVAAFILGN